MANKTKPGSPAKRQELDKISIHLHKPQYEFFAKQALEERRKIKHLAELVITQWIEGKGFKA